MLFQMLDLESKKISSYLMMNKQALDLWKDCYSKRKMPHHSLKERKIIFFNIILILKLFLNMKRTQFSHSVVSDSLNPLNHSSPGLLVHHQLLESTQTHVH